MERQRLRQIENPRPRGDAWGVYESAHPRGDDARKRVSDVLAGAKTSPKDAGAPRAILKREGYTSSVFLPPTAHPSGADVERTASPGRRYRAMPVLLSRVTSPSQGPPVEDTSILCDVSAGESSPDKADDDSPTGGMTHSLEGGSRTPRSSPPRAGRAGPRRPMRLMGRAGPPTPMRRARRQSSRGSGPRTCDRRRRPAGRGGRGRRVNPDPIRSTGHRRATRSFTRASPVNRSRLHRV